MCRSIKVLRNPAQPATSDDTTAAALQYVRKISGFRKPSKANQEAFDRAVHEIAASSDRLLKSIEATAPRTHRNRQSAEESLAANSDL
jgi:hypothetical protein